MISPKKSALALILLFATGATPSIAADLVHFDPQAPATNQARTKIGLLTCDFGSGFGYVLGSSKDLTCLFNPVDGVESRDVYAGQFVRVGADLGYTARGSLVWAVFAPSFGVRSSSLDGTYLGASVEAAVGLGAGANVLFGTFNNSINLVPVSVSGSIGLNLAGGLGAITLNQVQ